MKYPKNGRFGEFGGKYIPETLVPAIEELEENITIYEVRRVVKKLTIWKSTSDDEWINEILKYGGENKIKILLHSNIFRYKKEKILKEFMEEIIFPI